MLRRRAVRALALPDAGASVLIATQAAYLLLGALLLLGPGIGLILTIRPLARALTAIEKLVCGLLLGSGISALFALVGRLSGMRIGTWSILVAAASVALLAFGTLAARRGRRESRAEGERAKAPGERGFERVDATRRSEPRAYRFVVLALAACAFLLMLREGGSLGPVHDSLDFVAFVREILQTGELTPESPIYRADPGTPPDPRRGSFHIQIAALCRLSGTDPTDAWRWLPRLLAPLAILGFAAMLRLWLGATAAWIATLIFFATTFFTPDHFIQNLGYASRFGWVCGWAGLLALGKALAAAAARRGAENQANSGPAGRGAENLANSGPAVRDGTRSEARALFALAAASPAILLSVHLLSGFQGLISLGCAALAVWIDRGADRAERRSVLVTMCVAIALLAPAVVARLAQSMSVANPLFDHLYGVLLVAPGWPVLHPDYLIERLGVAGIAGAAAGLILLALARRNRAAGFLAVSTAVPLLIVFFPPIVRVVVGAHAHSLLLRVILVIPFAATLAWCALRAGAALRAVPRASFARRAGAVLLLGAVLLALVAQTLATRAQWAVPEKLRADHRENASLVRALAWLDRAFPEVQTVLSDPISSYAIPAYTRHDAVAPLHQHSSPADASVPQRIRDVQEALNGRVGMARTLRVLDRYDVDLLLVNQSWKRYQISYYVYVSPLAYPEQRAKFEGAPDLFEKIYDEEGIVILRVRRGVEPGVRGTPDPPNPARVPDPGGEPLLGHGPDALLRAGHAKSVSAGGDLRFDLLWRRTDEEYVLPVLFEVKLELASAPGVFRAPGVGRIARWIDEGRDGRKTRFGRGFRPLVIFYPDFLWSPGETYRDEAWLPTPPDARPGVYDIWARLIEEPFEPVTTLGEVWSNRLGPEWRRLGRVTIEAASPAPG